MKQLELFELRNVHTFQHRRHNIIKSSYLDIFYTISILNSMQICLIQSITEMTNITKVCFSKSILEYRV